MNADAITTLAHQSESSARLQQIQRHQNFFRLADHPELQSEAIALHYLSLQDTARDLLELIKYEKYGRISVPAGMIEELTNRIKIAHAGSFGLELNWDKSEEWKKADR